MKLFRRIVGMPATISLGALAVLMTLGCLVTKPTSEEESLGFGGDIEGIMSKFCFECHGVEHQEADLDLRTVDSILTGGESGPAIVPGHPEESLLLDMIHDEHMPPEGEMLTEKGIEQVRQWIASGASP
ncbi:MAG: c-type cytochrome domain-containing protein [Roseibacillus sp.]